jgi:protein ImuB
MSLKPVPAVPVQQPDPAGDALLCGRTVPLLAALEPAAPAAAAAGGELWAGLHLPGLQSEDKLRTLATAMQAFTPRVSLEPPDGLLLEVRGSLHLFQGVEGTRHRLLAACQDLAQPAVLSFAPTPLAALAVARAGKSLTVLSHAQLTGQLSALPLSVLRWPQPVVERLQRAGVRTVGAALRLPRAGFARRFGTAQLATLDALTASTRPVRRLFKPRERFRRRRELSCELSNHEWLLNALLPMLEELEHFLRARQRGVMQLACHLVHRHAETTRCVLNLAAPAFAATQLAALLRVQLEALTLPEPVRALELRAATLLPRTARAQALWQPGEHGGSLGSEAHELIERLHARLGEGALHGLTVLEGHRPERTWAVSAPPPLDASVRRAAVPVPAVPRPLWLLKEPQPLEEHAGLPQRGGTLTLVSEPERIESGWWDGGDIARDYYSACDAHGVRLWVFRERRAPHGWFLHGIFG